MNKLSSTPIFGLIFLFQGT